MCLVTKQKEAKIATKDIVVYKIIHKTETGGEILYKSLYFYNNAIIYELNVEYNQEIGINEIDTLLSFCFHDNISAKQYTDFLRIHKEAKELNWVEGTLPNFKSYIDDSDYVVIGRGLHSATNLNRGIRYITYISDGLLQCIIPKGSEYYKDSTGLIVSNKLIPIREIKANNITKSKNGKYRLVE